MYILFSHEGMNYRRKMYIGQTDNVKQRLKSHLKKKEFWECAFIFSLDNKHDKRFNRSEIQYLEYICIKTFIEYGYSELIENCQIPCEPYLDDDDKQNILNIFEDIRLLLDFAGIKMLGWKLFDFDDVVKGKSHNIISRVAKEYQNKKYSSSYDDYGYDDYEEERSLSYYMKGVDYYGVVIVLSDESVMIMPGGYISEMSNDNWNVLCNLIKDADDRINRKTRYIKKDIIVSDLSKASQVICGTDRMDLWREYT